MSNYPLDEISIEPIAENLDDLIEAQNLTVFEDVTLTEDTKREIDLQQILSQSHLGQENIKKLLTGLITKEFIKVIGQIQLDPRLASLAVDINKQIQEVNKSAPMKIEDMLKISGTIKKAVDLLGDR